MKWTALSIAGLLALTLTVPGLAQEGKPEARKVMLKQKLTKDLKITTESEASTITEVKLENGMVVQTEVESEAETQVTEILEVAEAGNVTKLRVRWVNNTTETIKSAGGQEGEPIEEEGAHKGASVLHTWNAEKKAWENTLEKGDKEASEVKKQLAKKDPLANPMIPNREVKVGEEWKADEQALKDFFGGNEGMKLTKAEGTLKAEEIVKEEGAEYLRVSFDLKFTGELQDENIGKPEVTFTNKGSYYFNLKESRVYAVQMETEGEFSADVNDPNMGKMKLTVAIAGERAMEDSFGKVGDKDDDGEHEGKDDDDTEDEDDMD